MVSYYDKELSVNHRKLHLLSFITCLGILATAICIPACSGLGTRPRGDRLLRIQQSPNYKHGKFINPIPTSIMAPGSGRKMLVKKLFGRQIGRPPYPLPIHPEAQIKAALSIPPTSGLRLTWLGHACVLIEIDGYRILTDPVFNQRASPFSFLGPKRFFPSPLCVEDLPDLDAVILSHDHYDHLDQGTIVALAKNGVDLFVTPLGVGAHLESWRIPSENIIELDWWEEWYINKEIRVVSAPARHFSNRGLFDHYATQWASWAIIGPRHRVYFSGDTGIFPGFKEIGERLGPFDATLMHIGGYDDMWPGVHMGPEEALAAHQMLRGELFLPIHWGTFNLAPHDWNDPIERLLKAAIKTGTKVISRPPGQSVGKNDTVIISRDWWKSPDKSAVSCLPAGDNMDRL